MPFLTPSITLICLIAYMCFRSDKKTVFKQNMTVAFMHKLYSYNVSHWIDVRGKPCV